MVRAIIQGTREKDVSIIVGLTWAEYKSLKILQDEPLEKCLEPINKCIQIPIYAHIKACSENTMWPIVQDCSRGVHNKACVLK
jgi:hypothetical protein